MNNNYTLYHGDCLEEMSKISDKSIDMILCDLPFGTTSLSWDIIIPFEPLWNQYNRIIKDKGTILFFGSEPFSSLVRVSSLNSYKYDWVWEKNNSSNFQLVNYQPLKIHETISVFTNDTPDMEFAEIMIDNMNRLNLKQLDISKLELSKNGNITGWVTNKLNGSQLPTRRQWEKICNLFNIENDYDNILKRVKKNTYNIEVQQLESKLKCSNKNKSGKLGHLSSESKRDFYLQTKTGYPKSIIKYDKETAHHPTQKPTSLLEFLIKTYSNKNEIILYPTMGSGSTGVACLNTNRKFIGIEKDNKYFDIAKKRLEENSLKIF